MVCEQSVIKVSNDQASQLRPRLLDRSLGYPAFRRHTASQPDITANHRAPADGNASENSGARVDHHIVFDNRMSGLASGQSAGLVFIEAHRTASHVLVDARPATQNVGFADHPAGAVVHEMWAP